MNRLDHLRTLAARSGRAQVESHRFFTEFADTLVKSLGSFLGAPDCVALTSALGELSFDDGETGSYDGLRIERGVYRIPLVFRLPAVAPEFDLLLRLRLYLTRVEGERFECQIEDSEPFAFQLHEPMAVAVRVYEYLCAVCNSSSWFEQHPQHHKTVRGARVGKVAASAV